MNIISALISIICTKIIFVPLSSSLLSFSKILLVFASVELERLYNTDRLRLDMSWTRLIQSHKQTRNILLIENLELDDAASETLVLLNC